MLTASLCVLAIAGGVTPAAAERAPVAGDRSQQIVVTYHPEATRTTIARARAAADVRTDAVLAPDLEVVRVDPGVSVEHAVDALEQDPSVASADPNRRFTIGEVIPDDLEFGQQWGLENVEQFASSTAGADVHAPDGWTHATDAPGVVVAVVDTGIALSHPDLVDNIWTNPGETGDGKESNGIDDDGNGKIDDHQGWDFVDGENDPTDEHGHGTHVAGIIGAQGNNGMGVTGVAWDVTLMPLRVLDAQGAGWLSDIAAAFRYASAMGAHVVNASLGAGDNEPGALRRAIADNPQTLFVAAAGNEGLDNDWVPTWPCNHALANLVCVAASNRNDERARFSNYGVESVDLAAPGIDILSTSRDPVVQYEFMDGTSMATPFVAGAAALVWGQRPAGVSALTWRRHVVGVLRGGVQRAKPWMDDQLAFGGRLNLERTLRFTGDLTDPTRARASVRAFFPNPRTMLSLRARERGGAGLRSFDVRVRSISAGDRRWRAWRTLSRDRRDHRLPFKGAGGTTYCYRVRARDNAFNASTWGPERCSAVPLNDRAFRVSGPWSYGRHGASYADSYIRATARNAALRSEPVRYRTLALIATTCRSCGTVAVYRGGIRIDTISLRSPSIRRGVVIPVESARRIRGPARITIVVRSAGKPVMVEGLGVRRV